MHCLFSFVNSPHTFFLILLAVSHYHHIVWISFFFWAIFSYEGVFKCSTESSVLWRESRGRYTAISQNGLPNYQVQIIADVTNSAGVEFYPGTFRNYGKHFLPAFELIISHNYCSSDGNFPAVSDLQKFWALGKSCLITILRHITLPNSWNCLWNEGEIVLWWIFFHRLKKNLLVYMLSFLRGIAKYCLNGKLKKTIKYISIKFSNRINGGNTVAHPEW